MYCVSQQGTLSWSFTTEGPIVADCCAKDVNGDGKLEVFFGSCDDNIYSLSALGAKLWNFHTNFWVGSVPIVHDFDSDGNQEVICGSYDGFVYMLESGGNFVLNYVPGLSGFMQQNGSSADAIATDVGNYEAKKIGMLQLDGMVTGLAFIPKANKIIASTKNGMLYEIAVK
jgi:hypothetical protein